MTSAAAARLVFSFVHGDAEGEKRGVASNIALGGRDAGAEIREAKIRQGAYDLGRRDEWLEIKR